MTEVMCHNCFTWLDEERLVPDRTSKFKLLMCPKCKAAVKRERIR